LAGDSSLAGSASKPSRRISWPPEMARIQAENLLPQFTLGELKKKANSRERLEARIKGHSIR
jgi:hypothetical protein